METGNCQWVEGFTLGQKTVLRLLFAAFLCVAVYAVFLHSTLWGWLYLAFAVLGQAFLVLPALCGHCPYPYRHNDCLLMPAALLRRLMPYRGPRISAGGKAGLLIGVTGLVVIPQYWLFREPLLLALFWALLLPFLGFFHFRLCPRCRHTHCPANRALRQP